jgi:SAM-dependent methyltransferase
MEDAYRAAHFDLLAENQAPLSEMEKIRIHETAAMVPESWRVVVDVGCGDGRVSKELIRRGLRVVGIDWSAKSVAHFPGETRVCDIRAPWPFTESFDGAICCEVLEHLEPPEAARVVTQLKANTRRGFLVSVPAREDFAGNIATCQACGKDYHVWGHCQRFGSFADVDAMLQSPSVERRLIAGNGVRAWDRLLRWQKRLGFWPWAASYLCPFCGERLMSPPVPPFRNRVANKLIAAFHRLTSPLRRPSGWFVCRYAP